MTFGPLSIRFISLISSEHAWGLIVLWDMGICCCIRCWKIWRHMSLVYSYCFCEAGWPHVCKFLWFVWCRMTTCLYIFILCVWCSIFILCVWPHLCILLLFVSDAGWPHVCIFLLFVSDAGWPHVSVFLLFVWCRVTIGLHIFIACVMQGDHLMAARDTVEGARDRRVLGGPEATRNHKYHHASRNHAS